MELVHRTWKPKYVSPKLENQESSDVIQSQIEGLRTWQASSLSFSPKPENLELQCPRAKEGVSAQEEKEFPLSSTFLFYLDPRRIG